MAIINDISVREILDSKKNPTIEVKITTDEGSVGIDSIPGGTSKGSFEATNVDCDKAIENIEKIIRPKLIGMDPTNQSEIDQLMIDLDGTEDKSKLGANAILGVSLSVARTAANVEKIPLFKYLNILINQNPNTNISPILSLPMMVMLEGGLHGKNHLKIQEFLVLADENVGKKIHQQIKNDLESKNIKYEIGLEGGIDPELTDDKKAIEILINSIKNAGYKISQDVRIGLDIAANNCSLDANYLTEIIETYPIFSLEDPFKENDWENWGHLNKKLAENKQDYLLIGDDLFVTNILRFRKGIQMSSANGIIIKLNQIGTLSETLRVIELAKKSNITHIISHRSGETEDDFIADLAYATGAKYIKAGAPIPKERLAKYNRLKAIKALL